MKKRYPARAPSSSGAARQGSSSGIEASATSQRSARLRSGNWKRETTTASASVPARARSSEPSGARPTGTEQSSTSTGKTIENGRPSLKTFHARAAQISKPPAAL